MKWKKEHTHKTRSIIVSWITEYFYFCCWEWSNREKKREIADSSESQHKKDVKRVLFFSVREKSRCLLLFFSLTLHVCYFFFCSMSKNRQAPLFLDAIVFIEMLFMRQWQTGCTSFFHSFIHSLAKSIKYSSVANVVYDCDESAFLFVVFFFLGIRRIFVTLILDSWFELRIRDCWIGVFTSNSWIFVKEKVCMK